MDKTNIAKTSDVTFFKQPTSMSKTYDPAMAAEIIRRQKLAEQLMESGKQPSGTEVVGGYAVKQSPLAGLAKALTQGVGAYQAGVADKLAVEDEAARRSALADALNGKNSAGGVNSGRGLNLASGQAAHDLGASDAVVKAMLDDAARTNEMKNSAAGMIPPTGTNMTFNNPADSQDMMYVGGGQKPSPQSLGAAMQVPPVEAGVSLPSPDSGYQTPHSVYQSTPQSLTAEEMGTLPSGGTVGGAPLSPTMNNKIANAIAGGDAGSPPVQMAQAQIPAMQTMPDNGLRMAMQAGKPVTENLPAGNVLARDANNNTVQMKVPDIIAKQKLDETLGNLKQYLNELAAKGGVSSPTHNAVSNLIDTLANSDQEYLGGGQTVGRLLGTEQQSIRDKIASAKSLAAAQYIPAAGLTSGQTNSIQEQQRFLQALGSLTSPYEAQQSAIENMSKTHGMGGIKASDLKDIESTKVLNGVTYHKINGEWHQ